MPELILTKTKNDIFLVFSVMAHPNNERLQQEFVAASISRIILESTAEGEDIKIPKGTISVLLNAPCYEDIFNRFTKCVYKGAVAGELLSYIAQMHLTGHKKPSVNKAVHMAEDYFANAVNGCGKKGASSDISIRKYWEEYKTVVHLWAAYRICVHTPNNDFLKLEEILFGDKLDKFLAMAEAFRLFGEEFMPSHSESLQPLLPKGKTWEVSGDYKLPEISLNIDELPEWMVDRLKTYKNPTKNYRK